MLDYIIIGAGISGCYLSYKLRQLHPNASIVILEKSNRIGGRLLSRELDGKVYDMGGMRFSKTSHILVREMLDELDINYISIESSIPGSARLKEMLDNAENTNEGFVTYSWNHCYNPNKMSIKQGYDILTNDITLGLMYRDNKIVPDWQRVPIGFQNVCSILVKNINIMFNSMVTNINGNIVEIGNGTILESRNIIFTGQPDSLTKLTKIDYISSFIPYNALRIYVPYKSTQPIGMTTKLPLRKIQSIGNSILIYCDSESSNIVISLIKAGKYTMLRYWIELVTGIRIPMKNMRRLIYKYWNGGIFFYRPYRSKIETNITYINGDISNSPGWIEGSLNLASKYIKNNYCNSKK